MGTVLGLTGGIATGKSTASQLFLQQGFPVIDADIIAREVVRPGTAGLRELVSLFGTEILTTEQTLDRIKLGHMIFSDIEKRTCLNQVLDKYIRKKIQKNINQLKQQSPLVIVDIPLLYEAKYENCVDLVALVYVPEETQLLRLMVRESISKEEALNKIHAQYSIEEKKQKARIIFDNQKTIIELKQQIKFWLVQNGFLQ